MTNARNTDIVLEAKEVSKKFSYSLRKSQRYIVTKLLHGAFGLAVNQDSLRPGEFWAVDNVSFVLKQGETLGLIGPNGAGKSTILKMINGLFLPDGGRIAVRGKLGSLIELGTGFHPYLSGRENIVIKGALMGKSKKEVDELFQKIVDFSELGDFIDSPVKTYSSGMFVRLGFSVAIFNNPDILLMDEILAVGDFTFQQKCLEKINEMREKISVIFVSHSIRQILLFCNRVLVLNKGQLVYDGKPEDSVNYYLNEVEYKEKKNEKTESIKKVHGHLYHNPDKIQEVEHYWVDENDKPITRISKGQIAGILIKFRLLTKAEKLVIGVPIWDRLGNYISGISSDMDHLEIQPDSRGYVRIKLKMVPMLFNLNEYVSLVAIHNGVEYYYRGLNENITVTGIHFPREHGFVTVPHQWVTF